MSERFHWFRGATVDALRVHLNAGPVDRLEVHQDGEKMTLVVVYAHDEAAPIPGTRTEPLNESWICPPVCP